MKRTATAILSVFAAALGVAAQSIPDDAGFRIGKLDNGMTYYLYQNDNPKGCAEFFIAHNVGALQEEDNQNGLAHFLEHMAFNGTRHYPGKTMLEFLAKEGVRFGYNVNAYTSRTETVYNISKVPLVRDSFVDSVMTVLHDWSCDISCEQKALDDERGVISEEWRLRDEPRYRMMCRQTELVYKGGKHPDRTVLGTMEVINGFKREEILDFYDKWYRPDLQAIIIVGDFDIDNMEQRVRAKFSDITMPENPPQKPQSYMPPALDGPLFGDMTDPTIKYKAYKIISRQPYPDVATHREASFYQDWLSRLVVTSVLSDRMKEKTKDKDCPYSSAVLVTNPSEPEFYTSLFTITPRKDDDLASCVETVLTESERMLRYGISQQELDVAKLNVTSRMHLDREMDAKDVKSDEIVKRCIENFLRKYPCVTPIGWQDILKEAMAAIDLESIKGYPKMMFEDADMIYSNCYNVSEPECAASEQTVREIIARVKAADISPEYLEYPVLDLSIDSKPGAIVSQKGLKHGLEQWKLSNGATVYYRKSDEVKTDIHLSMDYIFDTGFRTFPQDNISGGKFASGFYKRNTGFRGVDKLSMKNYPDVAGINSIISTGASNSSLEYTAPKSKMENSFKAAYLQLTEPYFGAANLLDKAKAEGLKGLGKKKNSRDLYKEKEDSYYYGPNPWTAKVDSAGVQSTDMAMVEREYKAGFGEFSKMKVFICSDAPKAEIEEYVCKYIASLVQDGNISKAKENKYWQAYKGRTEFVETHKPLSAPVSDITYYFSAKLKKDTRMRVAVAILDYIMSDRYLNLIREERGGAYHVGFGTEMFEEPARPVQSVVAFQTRPELKDILLQDVEDEMARMCADGPTAQEMDAAKKYLVKRNAEVKARKASSIKEQLLDMESYIRFGIDYDFDYPKVIGSIDAAFIKNLARKIAAGDKLIEVYTEQ